MMASLRMYGNYGDPLPVTCCLEFSHTGSFLFPYSNGSGADEGSQMWQQPQWFPWMLMREQRPCTVGLIQGDSSVAGPGLLQCLLQITQLGGGVMCATNPGSAAMCRK